MDPAPTGWSNAESMRACGRDPRGSLLLLETLDRINHLAADLASTKSSPKRAARSPPPRTGRSRCQPVTKPSSGTN